MLSAKKELFTPSGGGYQISRSVRLRSSASAYFSRTPAGAGSQTTWTWSGWVKRGLLGGTYNLMQAETSINTYTVLQFSSDNIIFDVRNGGSVVGNKYTSAVYRDPSAWYHIVFVWDTTNATASDRIRIYVNGVRVTAFGTSNDPALNAVSYGLNSNVSQRLGSGVTFSNYFDGYLTEINFIDGQALTPSSFGETNALTGVWQPKRYAGTYGTNGFYLNFSDNSAATAAAIGKDNSGNGNNWTPNNISVTAGATYDSMLDVPTMYADGGNGRGNYCTWNPTDSLGTTTNSGNLNAAYSASGFAIRGTMAFPSTGKWYYEMTQLGSGDNFIGVSPASAALSSISSGSTGLYAYYSGAFKYTNGTATAYGATFTNGDVIGVAVDSGAGTVTFYKNNVSQGVAFTGLDFSVSWLPVARVSGVGVTSQINFGQRPFTYTPPTGFVALNTQNLPDATIKKGNLFFNTATWSSDIVNPTIGQKSIALGFQPDLVWSKNRDNAESHYWMDSVRGDNAGNKWLRSNATAAEGADALGSTTASYVFNSTGFDIVDTNSASGEVYFNNGSASTPRTYVGWAWNAGGSTVTNTSGSISSTVRANPTAGFSIVTCTFGNGSIGHGLGVAPKMIIGKGRGPTTGNWIVFHSGLANMTDKYLNLNGTAIVATLGTAVSAPTSTLFYGNGGYLPNAESAIFYCFAAVAGYSAFGSYTGNGVPDGPFVYLGFRPRFVMIKNTTNAQPWIIIDTARNTFNVAGDYLSPDNPGAENYASSRTTATNNDILSNGFKLRNDASSSGYTNASANTYIYAAFAENPFKLSLAR